MPKVILPPWDFKQLVRRRRRMGVDHLDEVWDGVYVMAPEGDIEHQTFSGDLYGILKVGMADREGAQVFPPINISDRDDWRKNYRCPDASVLLPGNPAQNRRTHLFGGPDFAVEILSPRDRSRKKFAFYAKVRVRELLLIDRDPWCLELYRLRDGQYDLVGKSDPDQPAPLASAVLPLTFRLLPGEPRPRLEVARPDGTQRWVM